MKTKWLHTSWFPILIGFVPNEEEWNKVAKKFDIGMAYPLRYEGVTYLSKKRDLALVMISPTTDDPVKTISHEAVHVVEFMFRQMGEKKPSEEFRAYCVGQITSDIYKEYMKTKV